MVIVGIYLLIKKRHGTFSKLLVVDCILKLKQEDEKLEVHRLNSDDEGTMTIFSHEKNEE